MNKTIKKSKKSKKKIKGGVRDRTISGICKRAKEVVNPMRSTKDLDHHLLDVIYCLEHYKKLYEKRKTIHYKRQINLIKLKGKNIVNILSKRKNYKFKEWILDYAMEFLIS